MLTDPFVLKAPTLSAHSSVTVAETVSLARVQEQGGTSVYGPTSASSSFKVSMRIAHSESNENKPHRTRRVLQRIDVSGVFPNLDPAVASAYLVIVMPVEDMYGDANEVAQSGTPLDAATLLQYLIGAAVGNNSSGALDETRVARLINGES